MHLPFPAGAEGGMGGGQTGCSGTGNTHPSPQVVLSTCRRTHLRTVCSGTSHSARRRTGSSRRGNCFHSPWCDSDSVRTRSLLVLRTRCRFPSDTTVLRRTRPSRRWHIRRTGPRSRRCSWRRKRERDNRDQSGRSAVTGFRTFRSC